MHACMVALQRRQDRSTRVYAPAVRNCNRSGNTNWALTTRCSTPPTKALLKIQLQTLSFIESDAWDHSQYSHWSIGSKAAHLHVSVCCTHHTCRLHAYAFANPSKPLLYTTFIVANRGLQVLSCCSWCSAPASAVC